jgi:hypothetical protein
MKVVCEGNAEGVRVVFEFEGETAQKLEQIILPYPNNSLADMFGLVVNALAQNLLRQINTPEAALEAVYGLHDAIVSVSTEIVRTQSDR